MNEKEAIEILEKFNKWRRGSKEITVNDIASPKLIGIAIDVAVNFMKQHEKM